MEKRAISAYNRRLSYYHTSAMVNHKSCVNSSRWMDVYPPQLTYTALDHQSSVFSSFLPQNVRHTMSLDAFVAFEVPVSVSQFEGERFKGHY